MKLAEARALCPGLLSAPFEPQHDARSLRTLARWMNRFSPMVACEPPDTLILDVTGCERLFRGMDRLVQQVRVALESLTITARVAVAPTVGAAWALAFAGPDGIVITEAAGIADALSPLPVEALRVEPRTAATLRALGIATCGQVLRLPRELLPARFGPLLSRRLGQALGEIAETIEPIRGVPDVMAEIDFDGPVDSLDTLNAALEVLVGQVAFDLARRGSGARQLEIEVPRWYAPPHRQSIRLFRPSRCPRNLLGLIRCCLESVKADPGFAGLRLRVPVMERLTEEQSLLGGGDDSGMTARASEGELANLIQRLLARLGTAAVVRPVLVESHVPERAYQCVTVEEDGAGFTRGRAVEPSAHAGSTPASCGDRPLRLLARPVEVGVIAPAASDQAGGDARPVAFTLDGRLHRVLHCTGPERIAGQWWQGHHRTRDYFAVETEAGERPWLFRVQETNKWYVHGKFE